MTAGGVTLTKPQKNRALGLIATGHGVVHWYNGMLSVLYPVLMTALGLTYSQVGFFDSGRSVITVLVSLTGGYVADKFGRCRLVLSLCLVSIAVFIAAAGFAHTFAATLMWLSLAGIGNSLWHPYAMPLLGSLFPKRRGLALAIHDATANTFQGLAPIIVGGLLGIWSWRLVTHIHLGPGLLMGAAILLVMPQLETVQPGHTRPPNYGQSLRSNILRNRQFLLTSGISVCTTMASIGLLIFLPLLMAFELDLSSARQGLFMGLFTFSGALVAPGVGTVSDYVGRRSVLFLALSTASLVTVFLVFTQPGTLLAVTIGLLGATLFSIRSLVLVAALNATSNEVGGSSIGALYSLDRFFGILTPIMAGLIADTFGLRFVFYFIATLILISALLTLWMRHDD